MTPFPVNDRYEDDCAISLMARDQYLREVAWMQETDPLTAQEQGRLLERIQRGRREQAKACPNQWVLQLAIHARTRLVEACQPVLLDVAKKVARRRALGSLELLDLVQEGNIALLYLLDEYRFDALVVRSFPDLVAVAARNAMCRALGESGGMVRLSAEVRTAVMKMQRVERQWVERYHRLPDYGELARELRVSVSRVVELVEYGYCWTVVSLQGFQQSADRSELVDEEALYLVNVFEPATVEASHRAEVRREKVRQALHEVLSPLQPDAVWFRYGFDGDVDGLRAWEEVAALVGKSSNAITGTASLARQKLAGALVSLVEREAVSA